MAERDGKWVSKDEIIHGFDDHGNDVTVKWSKDATPAQRQAAIDGVKTMAQAYPGIKRVWLKTIKVQPQDYSAAIAMEFADRKSFEDYVQAPAHTEWKKLYDPAHETSTTHDLTN